MATRDNKFVICAVCRGTNIEISLPAWFHPLTLELQDIDYEADHRDTWCRDCGDHTQLIDRSTGDVIYAPG